jgi:hypothetical protein
VNPAQKELAHLGELTAFNGILLPLPKGSKACLLPDWQRITLRDTQSPDYQANLLARVVAGGNIAVLLGPPSTSLCAVDIDSDNEAEPFLARNPSLIGSLRTRGAKGCQVFVFIRGNYPERVIHSGFKINGKAAAEWRGGGGYSVLYGIHPDTKKPYQRIVDQPAVVIEWAEIVWPPHWQMPFDGQANNDGVGGGQEEASVNRVSPARFVPPFFSTVDWRLSKRILAYIATLPEAVSGQGGHSTTLASLHKLRYGFALADEDLRFFAQQYNALRCRPRWSKSELEHKITEATSKGFDAGWAYLIKEHPQPAQKREGSGRVAPHSVELGVHDGPKTEDESLTPFPVDSLPEPLRAMARAISESVNVHINLPATAVLGVCSAAIGKGLCVSSGPDQYLRANLYTLAAAISGAGKSEGSKPAIQPFWKEEASKLGFYQEVTEPELIAEQRRLNRRVRHLEDVLAKEKKGAVSDRDSLREEQEKAVGRLLQIKDLLVVPSMLMEDVTQEEGAILLASNGEKVFSFSSEASKAIANLEGLYNRLKVPDENLLVKGYSGDPHIVHRVGRSTLHLASPCISLLWYLQPDLLERLLGNSRLRVGGFFARLLICDTQLEPREIPETLNPIPPSVREEYNRLIRDLLASYWEDKTEREITVDSQAREPIRSYHNEHVPERKTHLADINSFVARWHEQALKLAVVLHAAKHRSQAHSHSLDSETMADAITIHRWFAGEQKRSLASARYAALQEKATKLDMLLEERYPDGASLRDLQTFHSYRPEEIELLAKEFPNRLERFDAKKAGPGRSSPSVRRKK